MNMILIVNYWLMMACWSMFLNGHPYKALCLGMASTLLLLCGRKKFRYLRLAILTLAINAAVLGLAYSYTIPYFFPGTGLLLALVSLNGALTYEYLIGSEKRVILPMLFIMSAMLAILSILIAVMPCELYTLFGKSRLFAMGSIIFLPYLAPVLISLLVKEKAWAYRKQTV